MRTGRLLMLSYYLPDIWIQLNKMETILNIKTYKVNTTKLKIHLCMKPLALVYELQDKLLPCTNENVLFNNKKYY